MLKLGATEKPLGAQRTDKPCLWRSLDRCIDYVKTELHIARFDLLDATNHSPVADNGPVRADTSERMRLAHEAVAHDQWFRAQVAQAIEEADDPAAEWVKHEQAQTSWTKKRDALLKRTDSDAA